MYNAIKAGYRLFDGAADYGNEKEAGEGLARAIKDSLVKREDVCEQPRKLQWPCDSVVPTIYTGITSKVCFANSPIGP